MIQIRFHGRGGQGAKTASEIFARGALLKGKHIQSFPEYGAARQGAPVQIFLRISDKPIRIHCGIKNPTAVVVLDPTLLAMRFINQGIDQDGLMLVNSALQSESLRECLDFKGQLFYVDATKISKEEFGRPIPNTVMVGALAKATGILSLDDVKKAIEDEMLYKFGKEITDKNIKAAERAYNEVISV
ncbi:pyruvate synthase [Candidatus Woesearchaeota archaeon]|jgi:pyruvate ferredoxin oxidoreductase gamma subunit|nr:pyruvate synthase [Candidatus Woesearchaeota archaeon]MBT3538058.1 pyruvate synthase [Candidatus Woesearchaeota archaeon]MBT4697142.1 pyruvate synthase [Candidatus Woesearchaeota archaeon]MBT4717133.1 pyruvate synthase [Candidatus Woesearchaeota archaeon]MBT7105727.1 pyruvate synthase [Candidatus Woesearchaeota archaeon]